MSRKAKNGDTVAVHYTGRLDDGQVFDSSRERGPLEFQLGSGRVIPGFERAIEGMEIGEQRQTRIDPEDAYGLRSNDLLIPVDRARLPAGMEPEIGLELVLHDNSGNQRIARIASLEADSVTLDLNHPLAGQHLTFDVELIAIR